MPLAMRPTLLAGVLVLALAFPARAEESEVDPDRPSVSDSARTVPRGAAQLETGLAYGRERHADSPAERRLAVEASVRAGVTDRLEVRVDGEPFLQLRGPHDDTGHGDLTLALKYRVVEAGKDHPWPDVGVLPFVKLPLASEPLGSERTDAGLLALASFELPWDLALDANAGVAAVGQQRPEGHLLQALLAAELERSLGEQLSVFAELFFNSRDEREGRDRLGAGAGVTYLVSSRLALDASVETTVAGAGPEYVIRTGLSVRTGR
jgi:hypothetical protein